MATGQGARSSSDFEVCAFILSTACVCPQLEHRLSLTEPHKVTTAASASRFERASDRIR